MAIQPTKIKGTATLTVVSQLPAAPTTMYNTHTSSMVILADDSNTGNITIGITGDMTFPLAPGGSVSASFNAEETPLTAYSANGTEILHLFISTESSFN